MNRVEILVVSDYVMFLMIMNKSAFLFEA